MKFAFFIITGFLFSCADNGVFNKPDFEKAIAFGKITELNQFSPKIEKDLLVRLYQAPLYESNCFVETHGICQYKYFVTVSTFDEYPETNVYELENMGEVSKVSWLPEEKVDYAEINLTFNQYSKYAMENNKKLINKIANIVLKISVKNINEEMIK